MFKIHPTNGKAVLRAVAFSCSVCFAQTLSSGSEDVSKAAWQCDSAVYIAGSAELKQNALGSLRIEPDDVIFSTQDTQALIPLRQIISVSIGDERVATGGTAGKVMRKIPLFGFGAAMGAVTSKSVDLLTIEYENDTSGYHGAVFELPKSQAEIALKQLLPFGGSHSEANLSSCVEAATPMTLLVAPIGLNEVDVPAEYRVLLYEQLVAELRKTFSASTVLRVGHEDAGCPSKTLQVFITGFKKGNEQLRSSTGPVGLFVGGTSLAVSIRLINSDGSVVFEKSLKGSNHGDSNSLNVTRDVARTISKRLAKSESSGLSSSGSSLSEKRIE